MTTYDLGDGVNLEHLVYDRDAQLAAATVALTVTKPNGSTLTPTITSPSTGVYRAATFTADQAGLWSGAWAVSGTVIDVAPFAFQVGDPAPQPYVSLAAVKKALGLSASDTQDDELIADAIDSVSREIEDVCERSFNRDLVATTRSFDADADGIVDVDDFYTTTGLIIAASGTWAATDYVLLPRNGVKHGRPGWPYETIRASGTRRWRLCEGAEVTVTARWGWASVPAPVREACRIAASETFAAKDARFGVAGFGQYGDIRVRSNPMVMAKLKPYLRNPVLVG